MSYKDISRDENTIYATRISDNAKIEIDRSISDIYVIKQHKLSDRSFTGFGYQSLDFTDTEILLSMRRLFTGCSTEHDDFMLETVVIRFGWLDTGLNSLHWLPVTELYRLWCTKELTATQRNKLQQINKALTLPRKRMVVSESVAQAFHHSPTIHHQTTGAHLH